jgi:hypothetical protein
VGLRGVARIWDVSIEEVGTPPMRFANSALVGVSKRAERADVTRADLSAHGRQAALVRRRLAADHRFDARGVNRLANEAGRGGRQQEAGFLIHFELGGTQ